jgi:hypothetical protein
MNLLIRLRNDLVRTLRSDPVKYCELYRNEGCSHVDGLLCEMDTCKERRDYVEFLREKNSGDSLGEIEKPLEGHRK